MSNKIPKNLIRVDQKDLIPGLYYEIDINSPIINCKLQIRPVKIESVHNSEAENSFYYYEEGFDRVAGCADIDPYAPVDNIYRGSDEHI